MKMVGYYYTTDQRRKGEEGEEPSIDDVMMDDDGKKKKSKETAYILRKYVFLKLSIRIKSNFSYLLFILRINSL